MRPATKRKLGKILMYCQVSIYAFITIHAILWYLFDVHILQRLCPFTFIRHVGHLEFNLAVVFWLLILASTLLVGRAFCAWGCMFGAYQDFVHSIFGRLRLRQAKNKHLEKIAKFLLFVMLAGALIMGETDWPNFYWFIALMVIVGFLIWYIVERRTGEQRLPRLPKYIWFSQLLGSVIFWWVSLQVFEQGITLSLEKYGVFETEPWINAITAAILSIFLIYVLGSRAFCRFLCPVGMLLRLTGSIPFPLKYRVIQTNNDCNDCGACQRKCVMRLDPRQEIHMYGSVNSPDCINCLRCVSACPKSTLDFGRVPPPLGVSREQLRIED